MHAVGHRGRRTPQDNKRETTREKNGNWRMQAALEGGGSQTSRRKWVAGLLQNLARSERLTSACPGPGGPRSPGWQFLRQRATPPGGPQPTAAGGPTARSVQGHAPSTLTPGRAARPWMVRMSSTLGVYFWLFPLHVEPAIGPDTFCFFKFSLVCDRNAVMRSKGRARICVDTEVPSVSL